MQSRRDPPLRKAERQRLVQSLVERRAIATQGELVEALAAEGCRVTQATASRDIRELGLEKTEDALGRPRYVAPGRRPSPRDTLEGLLAQHGRGAAAAQNVVVVRSEIGSAPAIGRALDRLGDPRIVGTLAGDDTCLVIVRDAPTAASLARELARSAGHGS